MRVRIAVRIENRHVVFHVIDDSIVIGQLMNRLHNVKT